MTAPAPAYSDPRVAALAAYDQQQAAIRGQMIAALVTIWAGMAAVSFSPADIAEFIARVVPVSVGSQRSMAALTNAYLQAALRSPARPISLDTVTGPALRGGVPSSTLYVRPIKTLRQAIATGKPGPDAMDMALRRLTDIAAADLQLAKTHTSRQVLSQTPTVTGYRRVLSGRGQHCALCVLASTQRYRSFDLLPMHPNCQCSVAPIVGESDPGRVLDGDDVRSLHEIIARDLGAKYANASGINYRDIIVTNLHGELGPVLGVRGQHFTGPDEIRRLTHDKIEDGSGLPSPETQGPEGQGQGPAQPQ